MADRSDKGEGLRILYVLPYVPSPIRVRPFQIIRHLAAQGHAVTVVALEDGLPDGGARRELARICRAVHILPLPRAGSILRAIVSLPTTTPLWVAWCRSPGLNRLLRRLAASGDFDVAHVEHLRAADVAPALGHLPRLLDAVDCITELRRQMAEHGLGTGEGGAANRLLSRFEWRKLRAYEPRSYRAYRMITVTSEHDARALTALDPLLPPIEIVPNGVALDYFMPTDDAPDPDTLVFSGKMSYRANDDAARYLIDVILPRLRAARPSVRLTIVGALPTSALARAAARAGGITVTGYVDDLRPYLRGAVAAVCPMRVGVGIQNKVLEAMAVGRPVVCSSLAARALGGASPPALQIADDPDAFAQACLALMENPAMATAGGRAARRYVEQNHDWQVTARTFAMLYRKVQNEGRLHGASDTEGH